MSLHASGTNATIDLFEHHLVITRRQRGFLFDGPDAEHMIPLASIKSVQFFRPGFLSPGKIVLVLAAGTATRTGTPTDPNTVFFSKRQLVPFENVLRAIQAAIATPSIERLAMAAQQQRSIDSYQPSPTSEGLKRIGPAIGSREHSGHWSNSESSRQGSAQRTSSEPASTGGVWRDMPVIGKVAVVLFGLFMFLIVIGMNSPDAGETEGGDIGATSPAESGPPADQMLADWSEFVTGESSSGPVALIDGSGKPGEFCNGSDGKVGMQFGRAPSDTGLRISDYFYRSDVGRSTSYIGAFSFDPATKSLSALRLMKIRTGTDEGEDAPDMVMTVEQISPGVVSVDGAQFHACIL
ncbi:hypothetical protein [Novosphingobium subterraneum]|uniref:Uncharacterized protein n=1 Tax=Novosphingobium subterraneum TaxID=48936 RepID=A0A0B8ZHW0_9SPHN|nr:hypothetical protein [Novosphingobium subterraneum]KHS45848.1 hypothetical protein NJ75_02453 [Novosphingobium subterraneum]